MHYMQLLLTHQHLHCSKLALQRHSTCYTQVSTETILVAAAAAVCAVVLIDTMALVVAVVAATALPLVTLDVVAYTLVAPPVRALHQVACHRCVLECHLLYSALHISDTEL
jgi:hypothetical protein